MRVLIEEKDTEVITILDACVSDNRVICTTYAKTYLTIPFQSNKAARDALMSLTKNGYYDARMHKTSQWS